MQRLAICATVLCVGCAVPAGTNTIGLASDDANVIAAIEAAERARLAAARAGDYETATQHMVPEFLFVHTTGQVDDLARFSAFAKRVSGARRVDPQRVEAPQFIIGKDVAVRTQLTSSRPRPGLPEARFRSLDVFVRRSGKWLWLAHQGTMVRPPWATVAVPDVLLNELAGTYVATSGQTRVYTTRAGALLQRVLPDGPSDLVLSPLSESTFAIPPGTATVTFLRDRTGNIRRAQIVDVLGLTVLDRKQP